MNYKVTAINDIGESPMTSATSIILGTRPLLPPPPELVTASQSAIKVEWQAPDNGGSPITSYNIFINSGTGGNYVQIGDSVATEFEA